MPLFYLEFFFFIDSKIWVLSDLFITLTYRGPNMLLYHSFMMETLTGREKNLY